jgi:tetratricopeptide (TPR) repeat protein
LATWSRWASALYLAPEHSLALLTLADTLERMKAPDRANEVFARHVAERRDHVDVVRVGLGDLVEMGERLLALAHLLEVDQPARNYWTLYYFRGTSYERAKDWPKAEADLKKARALHVAERRDHVDVVRVGLGDLVEMGERLLALAPVRPTSGPRIGRRPRPT